MTNITHLLTRILALATLSVATLLAPAAHGQSGQKHTTISVPQPSDVPGKIQVLEFFAYSCPHCATMEPMVEAWVKTLPENVVFAGVPVAFNASMADLQKLYYTLDALDRLDLHPKVFDAIHKQRKRIYDAKAITDWAVEQGIDRAQFEAAFNSFGINAKVARANELAQKYEIEGTPSLAVDGKYVTSPSMTGSYQGTIDEAQKILDGLTKS